MSLLTHEQALKILVGAFLDQKVQISSVYNQIENHNYEATKVRDVKTLAETTGGTDDRSIDQSIIINQYLRRLIYRLRAEENSLRKEIETLLQQKWFKELDR